MSEFDLGAASWRRGLTDEKAYVEALATRLEKALPGQTTIEREHRLFSNEQAIRLIEIRLETHTYRLHFDKRRGMSTERAKVVRGIALKTEPISFSEWLAGVSQELEELAELHEEARSAIERFLFS
ncbi:hypothetical protein [Alicyclobacillus sp. ALC3]|uniref:hypothetical protein n=1 Tax=Alicyclobacillus sp. ALC3 TaxID=2796143 RepID=UPI002378577E|nr:hypothetical protein [Alicyclobacillus sp. ALC3]WDL97878.1 hypothetical protein JC200_03895 [Alicyclobacillus sp. ALC3]